MSTRAVIVFGDTFATQIDDADTYVVYTHYDGYPSGMAEKLGNVLASGLAWEIPRYEADEFACAFIAANKPDAGGLRIFHRWNEQNDIEYAYLLTPDKSGNGLLLKGYRVLMKRDEGPAQICYIGLSKPLFVGDATHFVKKHKELKAQHCAASTGKVQAM